MGNAMPQPPQNLRPSRFSDAQLMHSIAAKHLPNCALMQATLAAGKSDLALKRLVKPENIEIANLLFLLLTEWFATPWCRDKLYPLLDWSNR
mgnify:FL=1